MDLLEYISTDGRGSASRLAKQLMATAVEVSDWKSGKRRVPIRRCPEIEKATNGAVRCEDLRPDVDWAFLRNGASK